MKVCADCQSSTNDLLPCNGCGYFMCRDCLNTCPSHCESPMPPEERLCNKCVGKWVGGGGTPGHLQHDPSRGYVDTIHSYGKGLSINIQNTGIVVAGVIVMPQENVPHEKMASRIKCGATRCSNATQEPETPKNAASPAKNYIRVMEKPW